MMVRVSRRSAWIACALVSLVFGCREGGDEAAPVPDAPRSTSMENVPNRFVELRPRAGDVLVPPQIGFRWRWLEPGAELAGGATGLDAGEFRSGAPAEDAVPEAASDTSLAGRASPPGDAWMGDPDGSAPGDETAGLPEDDDSGRPLDAGSAPAATTGVDDLAALPPDHDSESERVDAYSGLESPAASLGPGPDQLFRVEMVDSLGAVYARVVTSASSLRVQLPPHVAPGTYLWRVELLAVEDSSVIGRSSLESFEIR